MDEHSPEVVRVLLDAVVESLDLLLVKETQHPFLQLAAAFSRDDLDRRRFDPDRLIEDVSERPVDLVAPVVDVVEIELQLCRGSSSSTGCQPVTPR